jgi:predicted amidohydrolase
MTTYPEFTFAAI